MKRIAGFTILILIIFVEISFSQVSKIDSLKNLISLQEEDSSKVNLLLSLSNEIKSPDSIRKVKILKEVISLSKKLGFQRGIVRAELGYAVYFRSTHNLDSAFSSAFKAYSISQSLNDIDLIVKSYLTIGTVYEHDNNFDSAEYYYRNAIDISDSLDFEVGSSSSRYYLGYMLYKIGHTKESLKLSHKSLEYYEKNQLKEKTWQIMNLLGMTYDGMGVYDEALKYYLDALDIVLESNNKQGAFAMYNNIAVVYDYSKNKEKAIENYMKAFELAKELNDINGEGLIYNNLSSLESERGNLEIAIKYLKNAIAINEKAKSICDLSYNYEGMGDLLTQSGEEYYDSAEFYLDKSIELALKCQNKEILSIANKHLGILYLKKSNQSKALLFLQKSLVIAKEANIRYIIKDVYYEIYQIFEVQGNHKNALQIYKLYQLTNDSIFNSDRSENMVSLTAEYEFKKEKKLIELENEKKSLEMAAELEREEQTLKTTLIVLFLSVLLIGTLLRAYYLIVNRNKKLTSLNEEKNTLIGVVAHDLRSPLNNMKSLVPIIRNSADNLTKDQNHYLDLFDQSTLRMSNMINRILDVNAIESQKISLKKENCDITVIFDNTINSFDASIVNKNLRAYKNYDPKVPYKAIADKNYLIQVFENIISNAIKFSESDTSLYFNIKLELGKVIISVQDEGQGIKKDELDLLFVKYQKLTPRPTANESSTGLGLSNAKKYVEAMSGEIWCESTVGKGSTFFISFKSSSNPIDINSLFSL